MKSQSRFTNKLGHTIKILEVDRYQGGMELRTQLPYGYTAEMADRDIEIFREGLGYDTIEASSRGNILDLKLTNRKPFEQFKVAALYPYQLLIGSGEKPIVVNMNRFPHLIIGGDTGTGKSRLLLVILSNLIATTKDEVDIHLLQIRKNDLGVFRNCHQVKTYSNCLNEVLETLQEINQECQRREALIDNTKGYYSIEDYNHWKKEKLKYIYVVVEEFSFLNISRGDSKEDKALKEECLKHIKMIVNVGRSSGVFLLTSLQKPTNDSIPTDIKAQLTTRISMKIADAPAAIVIMGNDGPTRLKEREFICRTLDEEKGQTYTIFHNDVMEAIKGRLEKKPKKKPNSISHADLKKVQEEVNPYTDLLEVGHVNL